MHYRLAFFLLTRTTRTSIIHTLSSSSIYNISPGCLTLLKPPTSSPHNPTCLFAGISFLGRRSFSGYAVEQFSDDEYECDYENHPVLSLFYFVFSLLFDCTPSVWVIFANIKLYKFIM